MANPEQGGPGWWCRAVLGLALCGLALPRVWAGNDALQQCAAIPDDVQRLRCFDSLARVGRALGGEVENNATTAAAQAAPELTVAREISSLARHWESTADSKRGVWMLRPHKPNYLLFGRYTDSVNQAPYDRYFQALNDPHKNLEDTESKFQISFKTKVLENLFERNVDLWLGYTQQNQWQVYNKDISSPFRETNYEPEAFVSIPTDYDLLGLRGRFVNLGFVHQSNGRSGVLSRSWNRIYAQFAFEYRDNFSLLLKPWYRIPEDDEDDDNPHITDYMGDFEAIASYRHGKHSLTALGRASFDTGRGYLQLDWTYPIYHHLKAYLQLTTGYGESLIDYNHNQSTVGLGVMLTDWH